MARAPKPEAGDATLETTPAKEDGRTRRARDRREQTRKVLVRAARRVFAEYGYDDTSLSRISEAAGVTRGTTYQHFDGKADVFAAVVDDLLEQLRVAVQGVDLASTELTAEEQLFANLMRVLNILLGDPDYARLLLVETVGKEKVLAGRADAFFRHVAGMLRDALVEGQEAGLVRPLGVDIGAWAILGAIKEVMLRSLARGSEGIGEEEMGYIAFGVLQFCLAGCGSQMVRDMITATAEQVADEQMADEQMAP